MPEYRSKGPGLVTPRERQCLRGCVIHSLTYRRHVLEAAQNPIDLDDRQANAVAARIELDLRIGASFTRLQTLQLQRLSEKLAEQVISYGKAFESISPPS